MGVKIIPKRKIQEIGISAAAELALDGVKGKTVYVSIDADVGAGTDVNAVRFLDTVGLSGDQIIELAATLASGLESLGSPLAGIDLMEIDVHLADLPESGDRTVEVCAGAVRELITGTSSNN